MSREDLQLIYQQIRYAWQADPAELVRLSTELKQVDQVRAALLLSPDDSAAFEELLKK
jgi:hypothetical protein